LKFRFCLSPLFSGSNFYTKDMIEFRTTVQTVEKENFISSLSTLLYQIAPFLDIQAEEHQKITLIRIYFSSIEEAKQFTALIREKKFPINQWVIYDNNTLFDRVEESKVRLDQQHFSTFQYRK
jgi:hypothetical protein